MRDYLDNPRDKDKNQKNINNNNINSLNNDKKWERFGGKAPFSHVNEDPFDNNNNNNFNNANNNNNNEIYQKKNSNKRIEDNFVAAAKKAPSEDKKEFKDPMIWDPPEDRGNKVPNKAVIKPRQSNAQVKPVPSKNAAVNVNPYK